MRTPFLIGLAGGTGSGKGYIADYLEKELGDQIQIIGLDRYYHDLSHLPLEKRRQQNVDQPEAFDYPLLCQHLHQLKTGQSVELPTYDYFERIRQPGGLTPPSPIIVVEGILALADPELNQEYGLKVYVEADADIRLARRLLRDEQEKRHEDLAESIRVYLTSAQPSHKMWVAPQQEQADIILNGSQDGLAEAQRLLETIRTCIQEKSKNS